MSWPTSAVNYVLQAVPALNFSSSWSTVTDRPAIVGNQFVLTFSALDAARYYRLYSLPQLTIQWTNNQVMLSWPKSASGLPAGDGHQSPPCDAMASDGLHPADQC